MNGAYTITFVNVTFTKYAHLVPDDDVPLKAARAPAGVGRPRSERARVSILEAAGDLLVEGGLKAATMECIAQRAGVSKVTIYKWWPTHGAVAVDAYFNRYRQTSEFVDTEDVGADLEAQINILVDAYRGRAGELIAELIGQAQADAALADTLRSAWLQPRREAAARVVQLGIDRAQVRPDVDIPTLLDQLYAPVYWRLLMRHDPLHDGFAGSLVDNILDGVRYHAYR